MSNRKLREDVTTLLIVGAAGWSIDLAPANLLELNLQLS
jgi:hypothetical protein